MSLQESIPIKQPVFDRKKGRFFPWLTWLHYQGSIFVLDVCCHCLRTCLSAMASFGAMMCFFAYNFGLPLSLSMPGLPPGLLRFLLGNLHLLLLLGGTVDPTYNKCPRKSNFNLSRFSIPMTDPMGRTGSFATNLAP